MILEIKSQFPKIDMNSLECVDMDNVPREVYVDNKRVPSGLKEIILKGLDCLNLEYVKTILE